MGRRLDGMTFEDIGSVAFGAMQKKSGFVLTAPVAAGLTTATTTIICGAGSAT